MKKFNLTATATAFTLLASPYALATIEITDDLSFSGFGSTSVTTTDNKTPLFLNREITDETCYDCDTNLGLQLDYLFLDNFNASIQVMKRPQDEWSEPQLEWAYIGYNYEQFDIKAGRLRLPIFLDSEVFYVGHAYTAARPVAEVYDSILGITSYDGLGVTWNAELTDDLSLTVNPYGAISGKPEAEKGDLEYEFEINYSTGLAIDLASFDYKIHFNIFHANFSGVATQNGQALPGGLGVFKDQNFTLYSLGGEYTWEAVTLRAETYYADHQFNWYTQAGYNIGIFTPYVSYAEMYYPQDAPQSTKRNNTITAGIRFDVTPSISINAEYQRTEAEKNNPFDSNGQFTTPFVDGKDIDANVYTLMVNFII